MKTLLKFLKTHIPSTSWDYLGHLKDPISAEFYERNTDAWPLTIVTKINQISATIFKDSLWAGGNYIIIHPNLKQLIELPDYFNGTSYQKFDKYEMFGTLSGKYNIIVIPSIDNIEKNKLYVCRVEKDDFLNWKSYTKVGVIEIKNYGIEPLLD